MAEQGAVFPIYSPPGLDGLPDFFQHDYIRGQSLLLGDNYDGLWWTFTPLSAGLVSLDSFLSTAVDGSLPDPSSGLVLTVVPYVNDSLLGGTTPGWKLLTTLASAEPGGGALQQQIFLIDESAVGTPVGIGAYGAVVDTAEGGLIPDPILITMRVSDIVPFTYSEDDWENGPLYQEAFTSLDKNGMNHGADPFPVYTGSYVTRTSGNTESTTAYTESYNGAWSVGRRAWQNYYTEIDGLPYGYRRTTSTTPVDMELYAGHEYGPGDFAGAMSPNYLSDSPPGLVGLTVGQENRPPPGVGYEPNRDVPEQSMRVLKNGIDLLQANVTYLESGLSLPSGQGFELGAPPTGKMRLYDGLSGPVGVSYGATPKLIKMEVAADETITSNQGAGEYDAVQWTAGSTRWYMALREETAEVPWGLHLRAPGENAYDAGSVLIDLPTFHYGAAGPESMDSAPWTAITEEYSGGSSAWHEIPKSILDAAKTYEAQIATSNFDRRAEPGLIFTCVSSESKSAVPMMDDAQAFGVVNALGRWNQDLVIRRTVAYRYQDVDPPELFDLVDTTIEIAPDESRARFT